MSVIIEKAGRTPCDDIFGGGIASTLLWNGPVDRQSVSYRIHGSNYLARSFFRTEQSDSDQDDVQQPRYKAIQCHYTRRYNATIQGS